MMPKGGFPDRQEQPTAPHGSTYTQVMLPVLWHSVLRLQSQKNGSENSASSDKERKK